MARFVATDYAISVNGQDYSSNIAAVTLDITADAVETTSFSSDYRNRIGGLKDASVTIDWHQDFGASGIDSVLFPLIGANATVVIKPTSGAISSSNPSYAGIFLSNPTNPTQVQSATWPRSVRPGHWQARQESHALLPNLG